MKRVILLAYKIAVIGGDGIGPEVTSAALDVLTALGLNAEYITAKAGLECWKKDKTTISKETIETVRMSDACLFGANTTPVGDPNCKSAIVTLRKELDLYVCLRPLKTFEGIPSPINKKFNLNIVRENTEGLYSGFEGRHQGAAYTMRIITEQGSKRIIEYAFKLARKQGEKKITVVHKANIMKQSCGLFRETAFLIQKSFPEIEIEEFFVDNMAMQLIKNPENFKVIVTTNMFGDILSDEAAQLAGGIGLAASGNIGEENAIFEPVHGSAPDIAGKDIANPIAAILSSKMMLDYLGEEKLAAKIDSAVSHFLKAGKNLPCDLGGRANTKEVTKEIISRLEV